MHISITMRSLSFFGSSLKFKYNKQFLNDLTCLIVFCLFKFQILSIFKIIFRGFGTQSKKEFTGAFTECFLRLEELRSLAPQRPLTPMLALTATATLKTQESVERSLCVSLSPNSNNIYIQEWSYNWNWQVISMACWQTKNWEDCRG